MNINFLCYLTLTTKIQVDEDLPQLEKIMPRLSYFSAFNELFRFKTQNAFEQEMYKELLLLHAALLTRMWAPQSVIIFAFIFVVLPHVATSTFIIWCCVSFTVEMIRVYYGFTILAAPTSITVETIHKNCFCLIILAGISQGTSALIFLPYLPTSSQNLLTLILYIMPAASAAGGTSPRRLIIAYAVIMVSFGCSGWVLINPDQLFPASLLTILYLWFIFVCGKEVENVIRRSVAIRQERDQIVIDLEKSIADVNAAVAKAEHASQARARVLAAASHDLRQPLHALSVYSAVLANCLDINTLPEISKNIDRLVRSLGCLLHGLLDLSRLSANYYKPEQRLIFLDQVIENVCTEYTAAIAEKNIIFTKQLAHICLYDDSLAIARITRNLLDNASKYTEKGEIRVITRIQNNKVQLIIEDTGSGIPDEEQQRIFEEFYQLNNPGRDYSKGVGLGLAIVQKLAELINADIKLQSIPGQGSTFIITFSGVIPEYTETIPKQYTNSNLLANRRIYIIDDEIDILKSSKILLESWKIQVHTALSAQEGEVLFERYGAPDLLIVDLRLREEEHGVDLAKRLQKKYSDFPVLVLTGETDTDSLIKTNSAGYELLQKPISAEILFETLYKSMSITNMT